MQLTQTEAWYLGEAIKGETLMSRKLATYREMAQDPKLRALIENLERACERHLSLLSSHVK
ncbi:MAG TPA: hypothetical protein GX500_06885 [Firmicutes bacterium]|nr:hypothetical protein [Candidatus Fermentithermobacillaceae bacterium]